MTMLEKAARAAYDGHGLKPRDDMGGSLKFDQLAKFRQENWFNAARAVLMAVREPEIDGVFDSNNGRGQPYWYEEAARSDFTAMIDAILNGK